MGDDCGATVLVVDDDDAQRELIRTVLGRAGFSMVDAASGEEAMAAARRHLPRLVVLDVRMPDLSGYEVYCPIDGHRDMGMEAKLVVGSGSAGGGTTTNEDKTSTSSGGGYGY